MRSVKSMGVLAASLFVSSISPSPPAAGASPTTPKAVLGIEVVDAPDLRHPQQMSLSARVALRTAIEAASAPDSDLGAPYIDKNGSLHLRYVTTRGASAAQLVRTKMRAAGIPEESVPTVTEHAAVSMAQLNAIGDKLVGYKVGGLMVSSTGTDLSSNRVNLEVTTLDESGIAKLAHLIGDVTQVELTLNTHRYSLAANRGADSSPFWGGAAIAGCTAGFAWQASSTTVRMLTAGHCYPQGATRGASPVGTVYNTNGSNWNSTNGTVTVIGGANRNVRGDFAMITIASGGTATNRVYINALNTTTSRVVLGEWATEPMLNEQFCSDGAVTFEMCGWKVQYSTYRNIAYSSTAIARQVYVGVRYDSAQIIKGDSGGPVYTIVSGTPNVQAKGIISGSGTDANGGHTVIFGSIHDVRNLWLGTIKAS